MGDRYTVWVGGMEVIDYYVSLFDAHRIAQEYIDDGYDDVVVVKEVE